MSWHLRGSFYRLHVQHKAGWLDAAWYGRLTSVVKLDSGFFEAGEYTAVAAMLRTREGTNSRKGRDDKTMSGELR
jgi:hypothetical protein